jgi:hypothetical protein
MSNLNFCLETRRLGLDLREWDHIGAKSLLGSGRVGRVDGIDRGWPHGFA